MSPQKNKTDSRVKKKAEKKEEKPPSFPFRRWPEPETIEILKEKWEKPGTRVAYISYGPYRTDGWRTGLFDLAAAIFALEGCHFPVFAGGIVSKEWIQAEIKRLSQGVPRKFHPQIIRHVKRVAVEALNSLLPHFKKPDGNLTRWYLMASLPYDGPHGEEIIHQLQELRPEDIRLYKTGGERVEVRRADQPSIYHGVVLPKRGRLPAKYMSAKVERDIEDVEEQAGRYPDLWIHGTSATALYKPAGERSIPYISLPAIRKLEAEDKKTVENQVGMTVVEELPDGDRLIHTWSFRDLIAMEREFVTGIKEGASDLHKQIVETIKRDGARHPGRLADELNIDRETLSKEIQFLVEPKRSSRLTWPGLHYDEASQRYDFHRDWMEEMLRYNFPKDKEGLREDSFLFFGCMHAGYTTTDYEFVVKKFPEIILKYGIRVLAGVGDFIAGLQHGFMHKGEVFQMNNTEQEQFAGELIATVLFNVFRVRFEERANALQGRTPTAEELHDMVESSLLLFLEKEGNHDRWQEYDGSTALEKFHDTLIALLSYHIRMFLLESGHRNGELDQIIRKKMVRMPEHKPVYALPSGIRVGLTHPHMARADTTSLRLEKALKKFATKFDCQVVGVANFHVACAAHKWLPKVGQCVGIQTGTEVLLTDFEFNKLKDLDFGPVYLRTHSHKGKIIKTTIGTFNQPILKDPLPKWTDVLELKKKLGLLGYQ